MPDKTVEVRWTLSQEEHTFWLSQARECGLSVGEYIYLLASIHAADRYELGELPSGAQALRGAWERIRAARGRRRQQRPGED